MTDSDQLVAFLTRIRKSAVAAVRAGLPGRAGEFHQQALDLINHDLRIARWAQKREREEKWKRRKTGPRKRFQKDR